MKEIKIDYVNDFGMGVAVINHNKIFVPYTLPSENVTILPPENQGKFLVALPFSINHPSSFRSDPPCKYFTICGGCRLQHMNTKFYNEFKKEIVVKALTKLGQKESIIQHVFLGNYQQRRRTSFKAYIKERELIFGYFTARTNKIVDIEECILLKPELNSLINILKETVSKFDRKMLEIRSPLEISATLCDNGIDLLFRASYPIAENEKKAISYLPDNIIRVVWQYELSIVVVREIKQPQEAFQGHKALLPPGTFLQVSKESQEDMIGFIQSHIKSNSHILDLFAGSGTYSIPLSKENKIYAIEGNDLSINNLKNIFNIVAEQRDLYKNPVKRSFIDKFDYVVINPPRNGATPQITEISKSNVKKIIIVYCDIQSFIRDCKILLAKNWNLSNIAIIDQFYQSHHIELIGVLEKII